MVILTPLTHKILPQDLDQFSHTAYQNGNLNLIYFLTTMINDRIALFKYNHKIMKIFLNEFIYDQEIHDRLIDWDNLEIFRFLASNILGYLIQHYIIVDNTEWNEPLEIEHVTDFIVRGLTPIK